MINLTSKTTISLKNLHLSLDLNRYQEFIGQLRKINFELNAGQEMEVKFIVNKRIFYYSSRDFFFMAYDIGNGRLNLARASYPSPLLDRPLTRQDFVNAYNAQYTSQVDDNLAMILYITSESARSAVIADRLIEVLAGRNTINLTDYRDIIYNFHNTARYVGYISANGVAQPNSAPLTKQDYAEYFASGLFSGSSKKAIARLRNL